MSDAPTPTVWPRGDVNDIPDNELLGRAVRSLCRCAPKSGGWPRRMSRSCGRSPSGSTYAAQQYAASEIDPDQRVRKPR